MFARNVKQQQQPEVMCQANLRQSTVCRLPYIFICSPGLLYSGKHWPGSNFYCSAQLQIVKIKQRYLLHSCSGAPIVLHNSCGTAKRACANSTFSEGSKPQTFLLSCHLLRQLSSAEHNAALHKHAAAWEHGCACCQFEWAGICSDRLQLHTHSQGTGKGSRERGCCD
jgi:hypothetical protein